MNEAAVKGADLSAEEFVLGLIMNSIESKKVQEGKVQPFTEAMSEIRKDLGI